MGKTYVIVVAAGESLRFGSDKQSAYIKGKSVLERTLNCLEQHSQIDEVILVLNEEAPKDSFASAFPKIKKIVIGGKERQDSMEAGFREVKPDPESLVLVHDGARPLVKKDLISRVIKAAQEYGAAVPGLPIRDTVKSVQGETVQKTLDRSRLYACQTPQGFRYSMLRSALDQAAEEGFLGTDEASLVERQGGIVMMVPGHWTNIKITFPEDIKIAEALVED
ncbi:MAG: 2-C-methyl-D-erythritol 4-phosphate cytidylyltransferase [Candidatus Aminicenantes bacterium]|nr:2-C-methyl-D-erythritol 4-phosphate cytidylyltransferase [Candidatus Aminicenantes bacterium]